MSMARNEDGVRVTTVPLVYEDGRTKQSFKDSTDINKILKKAQKAGTIAHLNKHPKAVYGEFTGVDLLGAFDQVKRAEAIFADAPSEIREEFGQDALRYAAFCSDPANIDRLPELLPAIAKPGRYFPNPVARTEMVAAISEGVAGAMAAAGDGGDAAGGDAGDAGAGDAGGDAGDDGTA